MTEHVIAVCSPELHGDVLWAVPAARALAARCGCQADFWLAHWGKNVADLLGAQRFIRRVIVSETWNLEQDCSTVEMVDGFLVKEPPGLSHVIREPHGPKFGYEIVYQLGFSNTLVLGRGTLLDYFCNLAGVGRQGHHFDLPDGCPAEPVPDGPFVAMANKGIGEMARTGWGQVFRDFVQNCPIPVVEIGAPGTALGTDLGAIDRTRPGFLEMAGVISKCKYFIGNVSAPLVVADAFPNVIRIGVTKGEVNLGACTTSGGKNFYPQASTYRELLQYIEEAR
jgi:hypothetical protein